MIRTDIDEPGVARACTKRRLGRRWTESNPARRLSSESQPRFPDMNHLRPGCIALGSLPRKGQTPCSRSVCTAGHFLAMYEKKVGMTVRQRESVRFLTIPSNSVTRESVRTLVRIGRVSLSMMYNTILREHCSQRRRGWMG